MVGLTDVSRRTLGKVKQNLRCALGYNAFAIPVAAGIFYGLGFLLPSAVGVLLILISRIIVAVNSMALKWEP